MFQFYWNGNYHWHRIWIFDTRISLYACKHFNHNTYRNLNKKGKGSWYQLSFSPIKEATENVCFQKEKFEGHVMIERMQRCQNFDTSILQQCLPAGYQWMGPNTCTLVMDSTILWWIVLLIYFVCLLHDSAFWPQIVLSREPVSAEAHASVTFCSNISEKYLRCNLFWDLISS